MEKKVLVAYASKQGATAEIAEKIGNVIRDAGLVVDVFPADQVRDPGTYDVIVLGSAVYYGRWQKDAVTFLKRNEKFLADLPVWFFSSGPVGEGDPVDLLDGWHFPPLQQEIADRIQPRGIRVFHGVLRNDKLNFFEKWIMNNFESPEGDFRDWDAITAWAKTITEGLK
ncbi:MAG: flavodoxin domain-containing protein [Anaerolineales bacterium]